MDLNRVRELAGIVSVRPGFEDMTEASAKITKKLATSGSLEELKKLVAEFYATKPERITFIDQQTHWQVQSGEKLVTPVVVRQGKRFVFGTAELPVKEAAEKVKTIKCPGCKGAGKLKGASGPEKCKVCDGTGKFDFQGSLKSAQAKMTKESDDSDAIGKTIAQQMGGPGRIRMMIGAKQIVLLPNGLKIQFPNAQRSKGNVCIITLRPDDTYDMEFFNGTKSVKKYEGIYNDALVSTFETQTGLYLKMSAEFSFASAGEKLEELRGQMEASDPRDSMPASDYYKKLDIKQWVKAAEKETGAAIKTPANKGPKKLKGKALEKEIEKVYYKLGHGVQIDIMDIGAVFKMGAAGYEKDGDIEAAIAAAIKKFRKN